MYTVFTVLTLVTGALSASSKISWTPCGNNLECGRFPIPLDYTNPAAGQGSLFVTRYPAKSNPARGSLLLNPGGPGGSGSAFLAGGAEEIALAVGPEWNLIGWDPRGVNLSVPRINCFQDLAAAEAFALAHPTPFLTGIHASLDLNKPEDNDYFFSQVNATDAALKAFYEACLQTDGDNLRYVGSPANVRDMVALVDELDGPGADVNFYGLSYGTILGVYLTQMFPERVGRVIIDGVVDPVKWSTEPPYLLFNTDLHDTETVFKGFATACAAAGENCAIALQGNASTPDSVINTIDSMISTAYSLRGNASVTNITTTLLRDIIHNGLYTPSAWALFAEDLKEIYDALQNIQPWRRSLRIRSTPLVPQRLKQIKSNEETLPDLSYFAITCADAIDPDPSITTLDIFNEMAQAAKTFSPRFGPLWGSASFFCHVWRSRAVERYTGPFNRTTKYPIITIGTEADPVTPFISARRVDSLLGNSSRLIMQEGFGHTTLGVSSNCTMLALVSYLTEGTLPSADDNTKCGTDMDLFSGTSNTRNYLANVDGQERHSLQAHSKTLLIISITLAVLTLILLGFILRHRSRSPKKQSSVVKDLEGATFPAPISTDSDPYNGKTNSNCRVSQET